jgi:hypothetical protein
MLNTGLSSLHPDFAVAERISNLLLRQAKRKGEPRNCLRALAN